MLSYLCTYGKKEFKEEQGDKRIRVPVNALSQYFIDLKYRVDKILYFSLEIHIVKHFKITVQYNVGTDRIFTFFFVKKKSPAFAV